MTQDVFGDLPLVRIRSCAGPALGMVATDGLRTRDERAVLVLAESGCLTESAAWASCRSALIVLDAIHRVRIWAQASVPDCLTSVDR
jgi:hypothetical protein